MARPKNDPDAVQAKERIIDAFWELLEDCSLGDMTVSQVASRAHCTRSTFYYHYTDIGALIDSALGEEALSRNGAPGRIFAAMASQGGDSTRFEFDSLPMRRVSLAMRRGGREAVENAVTQTMMGMWKAVLCPDGGEIEVGAQVVIRHAICGVLGLVRMSGERPDDPKLIESIKRHLGFITPVYIGELCKAQGVSEDDLKMRLSVVGHFIAQDLR